MSGPSLSQTYMILRVTTPRPDGAVRSFNVRPQRATLEQHELDAQDRAELAGDPEVRAIVPPIRTKLIRPFASGAAVGDAWGVSAVQADGSPAAGRGVTVAVLDTGIDATHEAFAGVTLVQRDFSGSGDGDRHGHGTHCAGTIFGRDVEGRRIGVAREVSRALIGKVLDDDGSGGSGMLFDALMWSMQEGAQVISLSLGFDLAGQVADQVAAGWPADLAASAALESYRENLRLFDSLMEVMRSQGAAARAEPVIVAASGNESRRQENLDFRIGASLPAAARDVLAVGAIGQASSGYQVADFSNTRAALCAPGVDIVSAATGGGLVSLSGTSMAAPHVAGVAALWWEAVRAGRGRATAETVRARLLSAARTEPFDTFDPFDLGDGLVCAPQPVDMPSSPR